MGGFMRKYTQYASFHLKGIQYANVIIALTDAASYMIAAMKALQDLFPNMLHLTCLAHGLHRLADFVRSEFPEVNKLVSDVKSVFVKVSVSTF